MTAASCHDMGSVEDGAGGNIDSSGMEDDEDSYSLC